MKNLLTEKNFMWLAIAALAAISFSYKGRCVKCAMGARMAPTHQVDRGQARGQSRGRINLGRSRDVGPLLDPAQARKRKAKKPLKKDQK